MCYFFCSVWMHFLKKDQSITQRLVYGAAAMLGVGGSTLLVTVLTMTADLIGENVVSTGNWDDIMRWRWGGVTMA